MHQTGESMGVTEQTSGRAAARGQGGQRAKRGWQSVEATVTRQQGRGDRLCREQDSNRRWEKHGGRSRLSYFAVPGDKLWDSILASRSITASRSAVHSSVAHVSGSRSAVQCTVPRKRWRGKWAALTTVPEERKQSTPLLIPRRGRVRCSYHGTGRASCSHHDAGRASCSHHGAGRAEQRVGADDGGVHQARRLARDALSRKQ